MTITRCDGMARRDFVRVGGISALGLGLGNYFRMQRASAAGPQQRGPKTKAKSCILIWLDGGPSHIETFDPKPEAPEEVRGPLQSIATNLAGVRLNECMERTAQIMDKLAVVRSMTSPLGEHNFGTHYLMTGYKPTPALEYPSFGSTLAHFRSDDAWAENQNSERDLPTNFLPPNVAIPSKNRNINPNGFLPEATAPFAVVGNPDRPDFKVRDLDFYQGLDLPRLDRRRRFVDAINEFGKTQTGSPQSNDPDLERAFNLIASAEAKRAFDLASEPRQVRDQYGRGANGIGQSCLLARRLVERGVPFVTVNSTGWDTHQSIVQLKERFGGDRNAHLPALDRALSALVSDLADRGMLEETLVVVMGEFGRTPKINTRGGRDHWPNVFSVALAGGGIRGGQIIGASDALGELPKERPVTPSDLAATIYTLLGINPASELHTRDGRPVRVAPPQSIVVPELIA
ncbi:MAG: DUF1501 domain-containing protein [Pirellulaceae bacterium]